VTRYETGELPVPKDLIGVIKGFGINPKGRESNQSILGRNSFVFMNGSFTYNLRNDLGGRG
jgi:hypothetical protein